MSHHETDSEKHQVAAALIRGKISRAFSHEPPVTQSEISHRAYFEKLAASGASAEQIQQAWHAYYQGLSSDEKRRVWQEYYGETSHQSLQPDPQAMQADPVATVGAIDHPKTPGRRRTITPSKRLESVADVKQEILQRVTQRAGHLRRNKHVRGLSFAFITGALVFIVNFNELAVAQIKAYVAPGSQSSTPVIIGSGADQPVGPEAKVIIPKINVEVPVVYDEQSVDERKVQAALERGVVHYADTPRPGELGNVVVVGHSSNNLFNGGKYKFAFVLLAKLENNDTFVMNYESKRYIYRVYNKKIVKPNDVSVLGVAEKPYTVTLITCDPPGTAVNRLIIQAEQISPAVEQTSSQPVGGAPLPEQVPGNAPSFFQKVRNWLFH